MFGPTSGNQSQFSALKLEVLVFSYTYNLTFLAKRRYRYAMEENIWLRLVLGLSGVFIYSYFSQCIETVLFGSIAIWNECKAERAWRKNGRIPSLLWVYPRLHQHLWSENLARGSVQDHKLQCGAGMQQLSERKGLRCVLLLHIFYENQQNDNSDFQMETTMSLGSFLRAVEVC